MKPLRTVTLLLALVSLACPSERGDAQPVTNAKSAAPAAAADAGSPSASAAKPTLVALSREIMSTWWEIKIEQSGQEAEAKTVRR